MKFKKLLLSVISSIIASGVFAEAEWRYITLSDSGYGVFLNTNSITNVSEYNYRQNTQFWVKQVVVEDRIKDGLSVGDFMMTLFWINCNSKTMGVKSLTEYKKQKNGYFINDTSTASNYQVEMRPIIPETIGENFFSNVCS